MCCASICFLNFINFYPSQQQLPIHQNQTYEQSICCQQQSPSSSQQNDNQITSNVPPIKSHSSSSLSTSSAMSLKQTELEPLNKLSNDIEIQIHPSSNDNSNKRELKKRKEETKNLKFVNANTVSDISENAAKRKTHLNSNRVHFIESPSSSKQNDNQIISNVSPITSNSSSSPLSTSSSISLKQTEHEPLNKESNIEINTIHIHPNSNNYSNNNKNTVSGNSYIEINQKTHLNKNRIDLIESSSRTSSMAQSIDTLQAHPHSDSIHVNFFPCVNDFLLKKIICFTSMFLVDF